LPVVSAAIVDYRNFAVRGRGRIPKVEEDWEVELPRDQSASILKHRKRVFVGSRDPGIMSEIRLSNPYIVFVERSPYFDQFNPFDSI
jgi:hypothetical protein